MYDKPFSRYRYLSDMWSCICHFIMILCLRLVGCLHIIQGRELVISMLIRKEKIMKKEHRIQVRLDESEYRKLQESCAAAGMTVSTLLRSILNGMEVRESSHDREIMLSVCRMQTLVNELDELPVSTALREELNNVCQNLNY